jgi:hypothetical protein
MSGFVGIIGIGIGELYSNLKIENVDVTRIVSCVSIGETIKFRGK